MDTSKFSEEQRRLIVANLLVTQETQRSARSFKHVPCKFFKKGNCQAGAACPFSHSADADLAASRTPCKYFLQGNCRFGAKCANLHDTPWGQFEHCFNNQPGSSPSGSDGPESGVSQQQQQQRQMYPPQHIYPEFADEPNYTTSNTNYFNGEAAVNHQGIWQGGEDARAPPYRHSTRGTFSGSLPSFPRF